MPVAMETSELGNTSPPGLAEACVSLKLIICTGLFNRHIPLTWDHSPCLPNRVPRVPTLLRGLSLSVNGRTHSWSQVGDPTPVALLRIVSSSFQDSAIDAKLLYRNPNRPSGSNKNMLCPHFLQEILYDL